MIFKVFSVYDAAAEAYLQPFFTPTLGLAIRSFSDAVNQEGHQFSNHAADYTLFEIGEFDDSTGNLSMLKTHKNCGVASEFRLAATLKELTTNA